MKEPFGGKCSILNTFLYFYMYGIHSSESYCVKSRTIFIYHLKVIGEGAKGRMRKKDSGEVEVE